ncbi:MAG: DUF192 domain-containing protein [Acidimicrobiia bacterium]
MTTTATISDSPNDLVVFDRIEIVVGGETWHVAVADTPVLRAQGLMGVTELEVDGMLFVFEEPVQVAFHMQDTLIPLDIAFFSEDGSLIDQLTMTPCEAVPCQTYPAAAPIKYALETTVGGFEGLGPLMLNVGD